jgi:hypothetical protein
VSLFKRVADKLTPPRARVSLSLLKDSFILDEDLVGSLSVTSEEDFDTLEVRCEIQCVEEVRRVARVYDARLHRVVEKSVLESATLHSAKPAVSGPGRIARGYTGVFPFRIPIPASGRPTHKGIDGKVTWVIKGVIVIDGRPDVTSSTVEIQVIPARVTQVVQPVVAQVIRETRVVVVPTSPSPAPPTVQNLCPVCRQPLSYVAQYGRWYCYSCREYR